MPNTHNVDLILTEDPEWRGVIAYNEFIGKILKVKTPPFGSRGRLGEWEDRDNVATANWITERHQFSCSPALVAEAILTASDRQRFNPARDSVHTLGEAWDRKPRLDHWLETYCYVALHDSNRQYIQAISRAYLIGLVARILDPGCKRDEMLILQGAQGTMKSTAARMLADAILADSFTDEIPALHGKEAGTQLRGIIIAELSELDQFQRNEMETVKSFISRRVDRYREPYSRYALDHPRTVSFFGTSNKPLIFKDSSGGRRFWVCEVTRKIDIKALERDAQQLIGEAANAYQQGELWYLTNEQAISEACEEQEARFDADPWEDAISHFCSEKDRVTVQEITERVIDIPLKDVSQREKNRISQILQRLGFKMHRTTGENRKTVRLYKK